MGPAPSRFCNDDQEQIMRTVASKNNNEKGSTNDPDLKVTGSTGLEGDQGSDKVSTIKEGTPKTKPPTKCHCCLIDYRFSHGQHITGLMQMESKSSLLLLITHFLLTISWQNFAESELRSNSTDSNKIWNLDSEKCA